MRVLELIGSTGFYGAESVVASLARGLPCAGVDVCVGHVRYARRETLKLEDQLLNCDVVPLTHASAFDPGVVRQLRRIVKRRAIDVIHCHGYKPDFYGRIAGALAGVPVVSTCHLWTRATRALRMYARLDGIILRRFDKVVAVSKPILEDLRSARVPEHKLVHIPNGISVTDFISAVPAYRSMFPPRTFLFGAAGRQVHAKGFDLLLQAMSRVVGLVPRARLLIAGTGPLLDEYRHMTRDLNIEDHVIFLGRCDTMPEFYASLDAFLLPSRDEGLPIALLEAMASARTVIATDVGSVKSAVRNHSTGLLIAPDSLESLTSAMLSVISNHERLSKLGNAARIEIVSSFSSRKMVNRYAELYREVSLR